MNIFNPIQINEHIYQIRVVGCRVTLIINQKEICLVDIGYPGSYRLIKSGIESCQSSSKSSFAVLKFTGSG